MQYGTKMDGQAVLRERLKAAIEERDDSKEQTKTKRTMLKKKRKIEERVSTDELENIPQMRCEELNKTYVLLDNRRYYLKM